MLELAKTLFFKQWPFLLVLITYTKKMCCFCYSAGYPSRIPNDMSDRQQRHQIQS